ncbi:14701_t:CDS:2, partial [Gigaspora margarita]
TSSGLAQPQQNGLNESMEEEAFENTHNEEETNQEGEQKECLKDAADIKALLKKIKHLREDFERARDQFEYNALCTIENDSDLALSTSTGDETARHIESARTKKLDRTVVLNVAKEYDWEVAVELPQSKSEGLSVYDEIIERARQAASLKQQGKRKYSNENSFRASEFYEKSGFKSRSHWRQGPYSSDRERN